MPQRSGQRTTRSCKANGDPTSAIYSQTSLYLYTQLSGDLTGNQRNGENLFCIQATHALYNSNGACHRD